MKVSTVNYTNLPPPYELPIINPSKRVYIALDRIVDPYNYGSIIRTSYYYGVSGIIVSDKYQAPLSPLVSSSSCGAMEYMIKNKRIFQVNLPQFLLYYYQQVFLFKYRNGKYIVLIYIVIFLVIIIQNIHVY